MLFFWSLKTMSPWPLQMSDEVVHASTPKTIPSRGTYHRRVPYVTALSLAKSVLGHFMDHTAWKRFRSIFHAFSSGTRSCLSCALLARTAAILHLSFIAVACSVVLPSVTTTECLRWRWCWLSCRRHRRISMKTSEAQACLYAWTNLSCTSTALTAVDICCSSVWDQWCYRLNASKCRTVAFLLLCATKKSLVSEPTQMVDLMNIPFTMSFGDVDRQACVACCNAATC